MGGRNGEKKEYSFVWQLPLGGINKTRLMPILTLNAMAHFWPIIHVQGHLGDRLKFAKL
jgi:hypothetical protein